MGGFATLLVEAGELAGAGEDFGEHGDVEAAGVGVAEGGVVAAEEGDAVGEPIFGGVAEGVGGAALDDARGEEVGEVAVPGDLAEADDDFYAREGVDFRGEVAGAVADLLRGGLVARRGAADDRGDAGVAEAEAVVAVGGIGLSGEAGFIEDGVHEVAGAVSGEGAAGAVGSVGSGGEAEDEDAGLFVAEAGDGFGPVLLVDVGAALDAADVFTVLAETGAGGAGGDGVVEVLEDGEGGWSGCLARR